MSKSSNFLRNVIGRPSSPVSYTSDNIIDGDVDMSELSRQLEKIRLNSQQQQQQQKNVVTSISSELGYHNISEHCGLFDNFSADDKDDMFSWQGKPGSYEDDDDIDFSELFPELGSGKTNHSSCQIKVKQAAKQGRDEMVVKTESDTDDNNIEPISSSTSSFGKRKAEIDECYNSERTTKTVTRESLGRNKKNEANISVGSVKALANQKPGFKRAGKKNNRTLEYNCRHKRLFGLQNPIQENNIRNYLVANELFMQNKHPVYVGSANGNFCYHAQQVTANYIPERQLTFVPQIALERVSTSAMSTSIPEQQYHHAPSSFCQDQPIFWDTESLSLHYQWLFSQP